MDTEIEEHLRNLLPWNIGRKIFVKYLNKVVRVYAR